MKKSESAKQTEALDNNILVGYVRRSNAGGALKLSINTAAFADCSTYMTSDGQSYVPLVICHRKLCHNAMGKFVRRYQPSCSQNLF